ncbi:hypothetical protein RRF57_005035 [Xylaria bambusicola]|uniref:Uncharacterized protein n=1 Tax=Xylaria bambusicola TaxID=326684 RepID=A0AAN7UBP0_9PEZI
MIQSGLNNIIAEPVFEESLQLPRCENLPNHRIFCFFGSAPQALLNYVGAELVARKFYNAIEKSLSERLGETRVVQIDYVLNNVIAERVLDKT